LMLIKLHLLVASSFSIIYAVESAKPLLGTNNWFFVLKGVLIALEEFYQNRVKNSMPAY
jgi:hypothetical protein